MTSCFGADFQRVARIAMGSVDHLVGEEGVREYEPRLPFRTVSSKLALSNPELIP